MIDFGYFNRDCMDGMKEIPDKFFDLAICDPPYGIGYDTVAEKESGKQHGKSKCPKRIYVGGGGMLNRRRNTLTNFFVSANVKLYGEGTTFQISCRLPKVL